MREGLGTRLESTGLRVHINCIFKFFFSIFKRKTRPDPWNIRSIWYGLTMEQLVPTTTWTIKGQNIEAVKEHLHLGILRSTAPPHNQQNIPPHQSWLIRFLCSKPGRNKIWLPSPHHSLMASISLPKICCMYGESSGTCPTQNWKCSREPTEKFLGPCLDRFYNADSWSLVLDPSAGISDQYSLQELLEKVYQKYSCNPCPSAPAEPTRATWNTSQCVTPSFPHPSPFGIWHTVLISSTWPLDPISRSASYLAVTASTPNLQRHVPESLRMRLGLLPWET